MFFTTERVSVVEYVAMPTPSRSKFVFQQPKLSYENNLFLLSFKPSVWYSSVALQFIFILALFAVAKWEWMRLKQNDHEVSTYLRTLLFSRNYTSERVANTIGVFKFDFNASCNPSPYRIEDTQYIIEAQKVPLWPRHQ